MTVDEIVFALFLICLIVGLTRSALFLLLSGLMALVLAAVVDASLLSAQTPFIRYGTFMVLVIAGIILFVRGAMDLPKEANA